MHVLGRSSAHATPSSIAPRQPRVRQVARHAWLSGGLDTAELAESFSGLQQAQEITQRALGSLSAYLSSTMS